MPARRSSSVGGLGHFAQDGRVGALRDAVHAAHAVRRDELGDIGRDVAEVAQRAGAGGNDAARRLIVGGQALFGECRCCTRRPRAR